MTDVLILLNLPEPIRNQYRDRLRKRFPGITIELVDHHSKVGPYIDKAEVLITFAPMLAGEVLAAAARLKWVQALGTGVDNLIDQPALRKEVIVTNMRGIQGIPVSEAALAGMMALARGLRRAFRAQDERQWRRFPAQLLHDKTVGIFGVGQIAEVLAPKCKAFGMRVVGVTSVPRELAGFDRMYRREELSRVVGDFDFLVLLTPLTTATRNSINAGIFAAMKQLAAKALSPYAGGTIGLVGTSQMSFALVDCLQKGRFSNAHFVEASDLVDKIKAIKSAEEQELIRRAAAMQDGAMRTAFAAVEPGMRDRDVAAIAQCYSQRHGSENGIYLCASMPPDKPVQFSQRHYQNRVIQAGDTVALLVEDSGPGGMYTELGRSCVVGRASSELKDEFAFALEARKFNIGLLKPGASCKDVFEEYNAFMQKNGRPEERRLHCHGQGYDLVERPLIRQDEPMSIERHMNIVVHPTYIRGRVLSWVCDNYLIGPNGPGERLHRFPEAIIELG